MPSWPMQCRPTGPTDPVCRPMYRGEGKEGLGRAKPPNIEISPPPKHDQRSPATYEFAYFSLQFAHVFVLKLQQKTILVPWNVTSGGLKKLKRFQLQGASPPDPLPGALPLDPAGGSAPRPPLQARAPALAMPGAQAPPNAISQPRPCRRSVYPHPVTH